MRELQKLSVFHYVPPFRGRAIHFLRRDVPFEQLTIDFAELERRKAAELQKLEKVINYAQSRRCRQREILHYFGDSHPFQCHVCDNCEPVSTRASSSQAATIEHDEATLQAVQIVLSGAARTRGKVGKHLLAKMLCGSESAQISQLQLDKLSTFGLLGDLTQSDVVDFIKSLIHAKLLTQSEPQSRRPLVQLTELGGEVMRGQAGLPSDFAVAADLSARFRRRFAKASARNIQPAPLKDEIPTAPAELRADFDHPPQRALAESRAEHYPAPEESVERPNYYWTWRLLDDGYSVADCLAIRGIDEQLLLGHLINAFDDGLSVRLEWVLTPDQCQLLAEALDNSPPSRLGFILDDLPAGLSPPHIQLFCQIRTGNP